MQISHTLLSGFVLSILLSALLIISIRRNPRLWLQDYPSDIQQRVSPKTPAEKQESSRIGLLFMLIVFAVPIISTLLARDPNGNIPVEVTILNVFGILMFFNLVDLLILDWWMFCMWTPEWLVIPGTQGASSYKNYRYHARGFVIGTLFSLLFSVVMGFIVSVI